MIPQVITLISNWQNRSAQEPLTNAQAQGALGDAMEKLGQEYSRMLSTNKALEEELASLRPLTLKIALQEQQMKQTQEDKDDWKRYAEKLSRQLEEHEILPIPFRRYPSNGDTDKMKAVTKEQAEAAKKEKK